MEKSQKKRRNKEQEVAFENKDVKSSRNSKKHTSTKGSLLSIVLQEGKGTKREGDGVWSTHRQKVAASLFGGKRQEIKM